MGSHIPTDAQAIFSRIVTATGTPPPDALLASCIETPLGVMMAIADGQALYLLEFIDRQELEQESLRLREKTGAPIFAGNTIMLEQIDAELHQYFAGQLVTFKTPVRYTGTPFQQRVWSALRQIPHGETITYTDLAVRLGNPLAVRAVAQANGNNQLAVIIPCHRVVGAQGDLGGYSGGLHRKRWLIQHESVDGYIQKTLPFR